MASKSVQIESPELLERAVKEAEQSGQSLGELTAEALERELARRSFQRLRRSSEIRRRGMSEADVDERVERSIQEYRTDQRSR